jgi:hypothetical protein
MGLRLSQTSTANQQGGAADQEGDPESFSNAHADLEKPMR